MMIWNKNVLGKIIIMLPLCVLFLNDANAICHNHTKCIQATRCLEWKKGKGFEKFNCKELKTCSGVGAGNCFIDECVTKKAGKLDCK